MTSKKKMQNNNYCQIRGVISDASIRSWAKSSVNVTNAIRQQALLIPIRKLDAYRFSHDLGDICGDYEDFKEQLDALLKTDEHDPRKLDWALAAIRVARLDHLSYHLRYIKRPFERIVSTYIGQGYSFRIGGEPYRPNVKRTKTARQIDRTIKALHMPHPVPELGTGLCELYDDLGQLTQLAYEFARIDINDREGLTGILQRIGLALQRIRESIPLLRRGIRRIEDHCYQMALKS